MATWLRQNTNQIQTTDLDLSGALALDNATAPGDFDPAGVDSVRFQLAITGAGFADDTWTALRRASLATQSSGTPNPDVVIAAVDDADASGLANTTNSIDLTDSAPNTTLTTTDWELADVNADGFLSTAIYATYQQTKGKDGSTLTIPVAAVTVTITYTAGAPGQTLTGNVFVPTLSFPAGQTNLSISGGTFTPTLAYSAGTLTQEQSLTGALSTPSLSFPTGSADLMISGSLFASTLSFPQGQVKEIQAVAGTVFAPSLSFPQGTVSPGTVTLTGQVFTPSLVFPQGTVSPGAVTLTGSVFTPGLGFPQGSASRASAVSFPARNPGLFHEVAGFTVADSGVDVNNVEQQTRPVSGVAHWGPVVLHPHKTIIEAARIDNLVNTSTYPVDIRTSRVTTVDNQASALVAFTHSEVSGTASGKVEYYNTDMPAMTGVVFTPGLSFPSGGLPIVGTISGVAFTPSLGFPTGGAAGGLSSGLSQRLALDGTADNKASTPDSAGLSVTGDIDVRVKCRPVNWVSPAATMCLAAKFHFTGPAYSWSFELQSDGALLWVWSEDGSTTTTATSTIQLHNHVSGLAPVWLRVIHDVDNGASGNTVTFYVSTDEQATWTQFGEPIVTAGVTSIADTDAPVTVGWRDDGGFAFDGDISECEIYDGIGGTQRASVDFTDTGQGWVLGDDAGDTGTDTQGNVWTLAGSAVIADQPPFAVGFVSLDGNGDFASTPHKAALDIPGDLTIIACGESDAWDDEVNNQHLVSKGIGYRFLVIEGRLQLAFSEDGSTQTFVNSDADTAPGLSGVMWLRAVLDVDVGDGTALITFSHSHDRITTPLDEVTWLEYGDPQPLASTVSLAAVADDLALGGRIGNPADFDGKIYGVWLYDGATLVASPDFRNSTQGWSTPPGTDGQGNEWTFVGDTVWVAGGDLFGVTFAPGLSFPSGGLAEPGVLSGVTFTSGLSFPSGGLVGGDDPANARLGLFVTQDELEIWNLRARGLDTNNFHSEGDEWVNSPGDWDRIVSFKNSYMNNPGNHEWGGPTCNWPNVYKKPQCHNPPPQRNQNGSGVYLRNAAFFAAMSSVHLPSGDRVVSDAVRDDILSTLETTFNNLADTDKLDFSNTTRFNPNNTGPFTGYTLSFWLLQLINAYDLCQVANPDVWSTASKQKIVRWFADIIPWYQGDGHMGRGYDKVNNDTGVANSQGTSSKGIKIWNGSADDMQIHHSWDNHIPMHATHNTLVPLLDELEGTRSAGYAAQMTSQEKTDAKADLILLAKSYLINEMGASMPGQSGGQGSGGRTGMGQFYRGMIDSSPNDGWKYACSWYGRMMIGVDALARAGDDSLYLLERTTGVGGGGVIDTSGSVPNDTYYQNPGPKTLHRAAQQLVRYVIETGTNSHPWRFGANSTATSQRIDSIADPTGIKRSHDYLVVPFNMFFDDQKIQDVYTRSAAGTPNHSSGPGKGRFFDHDGPAGFFAGVNFQYGLMEGRVDPYL